MATRSVLVLALVLTLALTAAAQQPTGSIVGTVYDPTGAVVPGAKVTLRDIDTGVTRTTNSTEAGAYEFLLLRPSRYDLTVEQPGFRQLVRHDIVVNVGTVARVDLSLELGDVAQVLEVTGEVPLIEPERPSISSSIDNRAISTLPLEGRNFLNLALLTPGALPEAQGTQGAGFSVAGMRSQSNNYTMDGISNNDPQINSPLNSFNMSDAIQEFNVQTSIATTDVGRNSGAQVSIVTKGGGNSFHGSLFYYHRNDALDATPFFLNRAGEEKNVLRRHQFGGTIGGPVIQNKTFFFFSFEGFREKEAEPVTRRVPTAAERATVTDPVSQRLLEFYPLPNTTGTQNWAGTADTTNDNETYFARIDHNLAPKHTLTGRYALFVGETLQVQTDPFNGLLTNTPSQHNFLVMHTYAGSRLVNEFRAGASRNRTFFLPADVDLNPATIFTDASGNPLPGYVDTATDPLNGGLPRITISGGFSGLGAGTNMPQGRSTNTFEYQDNVTLTAPLGWSRHTWRFGAHVRRENAHRFLNGNYRGSVSFSNFANFAAGIPRTGTLRTGEGGTFRTWFRTAWYFYFQDTFKARPNLTFNYGLRYEIPGESYEKYNRGSNLVPGIGVMVLGSNLRIDVDPTALGRDALVLTPVDFHLRRSGQANGDYNNFGPFFAVSYSPGFWRALFGQDKTVIRTGFRLSYDDVFHNIPINMGLNFPPILTTSLPTGSYTWATVLNQDRRLLASDPTAPGGERGIVDFNAWDFNAPTAYGMNYALEIERQFGNDFVFEISYVGTQGRKLGVYVPGNQPFVTVVDPTRRGEQTPNLRTWPLQQFDDISVGSFVSNSTYNGMVVGVRKRPSRGITFTASWTYGKALDDNTSFFGSDADDGGFADPRRRFLERGRSGFDVRHRFASSAIWDLPFGRGQAVGSGVSGWVNQVIGGWQLAGILTFRTGQAFTIHARHSVDWSGFDQFIDRPNWASGVTGIETDYSNPEQAFNCTSGSCPVFLPPTGAGDVGNVGRNLFSGPTRTNYDFSILKNFPWGEGRKVQFRAEFFNAFNMHQFELPNHNVDFSSSAGATSPISSSQIGTISDAFDPRIIQLGLRIEF